MAQTLKDSKLDTREARSRLEARGKPHWRLIEEGVHLGYRKPRKGAGKWVLRQYVGEQSYLVKTIAEADDLSDADGTKILNFKQAQDLARERMVTEARNAAGKGAPLTVDDVMKDYLNFLDTKRKSGKDARYRYQAFIKEPLGKIEVNALTSDQIEAWQVALAKKPPRARTTKGKPQQYREFGKDDEAVRRRRSSVNRTLTVLKAALNRAWKKKPKLVPSDDEWRRVEPFENVDAARLRYLSIEEAKRLVNACSPDFRLLVRAGLQSGIRLGDLIGLKVKDLNEDVGTLAIVVPKTGKPRHIVLTAEGAAFFRRLCAGRSGDEFMLPKSGGSHWGKSQQKRRIDDACERAKIKPPVTFHGLRHTWASHAVMNGVPLLVVAKNLGHKDTRMVEKHYGHLAPDYVADAIRKKAPRFGKFKESNIVPIAGRA